jgi:hypothetical protein
MLQNALSGSVVSICGSVSVSSEWDVLKRKAAQELQATEDAERLRAAQARQANEDLTRRTNDAREAYVSITKCFCHQVRGQNPMPGAMTYTFSRENDSLLAFWRKRVDLVFVPDTGLSWSRAGTYGPVSSCFRGLLFGVDIDPRLTASELPSDLPYRFYKAARKPSEYVDGLSEMLAKTTAYGYDPEILVKTLLKGLAAWSARHWPGLDLDLPRHASK